MGLVNVFAAAFIFRRGQPKFAILSALLWVAFAATHSLVQSICGIFGLATVVVSYLYFAQWRLIHSSAD